MRDLYNNDMKDLNDAAYPWTDQTVERRIEDCIRLLKLHGLITVSSATKAWGKLATIKHREAMRILKEEKINLLNELKEEIKHIRINGGKKHV